MKNKKKKLKRILASLLLIFLIALTSFAIVKAYNNSAYLKTKTFYIYDLGQNTEIGIVSINDVSKERKNYWGDYIPNHGSIDIEIYQQGDGFKTAKVTMSSANVTEWTPYLTIDTSHQGYTPEGWGNTNYDGGHGIAGAGSSVQEVHNINDTWNNGYCLFYIGAGFSVSYTHALWSSSSYYMSVNWDSGVSSVSGANKWYTAGSTATLTASFNSGYEFDYMEDKDNGAKYYANPDTWGMGSNRNVYIHSKKKNYTAKIHLDGGSYIDKNGNTSTSDTTVSFTGNKSYIAVSSGVSANGINVSGDTYINDGYYISRPVKTGYKFDGWYLGDEKLKYYSFNAGSLYGVENPKKNVDIYAKWTANEYTLTYDGNGGTPSKTSQPASYGSKWGELATALKSGYEFDGWYSSASGGTRVTADTVCKGDMTVYAHWKINSYTAKIHLDGGTYIDKNGNTSASDTTVSFTGNKSYIAVSSGVSANGINVSGDTYINDGYYISRPVKTGYQFDGWYLGNTKLKYYAFKSGNLYGIENPKKDIDIYAHWTPNTYTLTINPNGGTFTDASGTNNKVCNAPPLYYNGNNYWDIAFAIPEKGEYKLAGFYDAPTGGTKVYNANGTCVTGTKYWNDNKNYIYAYDLTVYAQWIAPSKIIFDANGGSFSNGKKLISQTLYGSEQYINYYATTRNGYDFVGYMVSGESVSAEIYDDYGDWDYTMGIYDGDMFCPNNYSDFSLVTMSAGETTFTAVWEVKATTYTVEHYVMDTNGNYSSTPTKTSAPVECNTNEVITHSSLKDSSLEVAGGIVYDSIKSGTSTTMDSDKTIKLYYERKKYNAETVCGTGISITQALSSTYYGKVVEINAEVKTGYTWENWTGTPVIYTNGTSSSDLHAYFIMPAGDVTLTANGSASQRTQKKFTTIKIANSWHGGTFVRRLPGDEAWYNSMGKWNVNEPVPVKYIEQVWLVKADGTIEQRY